MALTLTKQPKTWNLSGNPVIVEVVSDTVTVSNHRITLKIVYQSAYWGVETLPVINNTATFDISDYLKQKIEAGLNILDFFDKNINVIANLVNQYQLEIFETYDGDNIEHNKISVNPFRVLHGGLSKIIYDSFINSGKTFYDNLILAEKRFLTWCPSKILTFKQHDILFFIYTGIKQDIKVRYTLHFNDNSNTVVDSAALNTSSNSMIYFCPSYLANGFDAYETEEKYILSYTVALVNGTTLHSEVRTYYIDRQNYNYTRQFLFRNSFGAYDTIMLRGLAEKTAEVQRTLGYIQQRDRVSSSEYNEQFKASGGFISRQFNNMLYGQSYIIEFVNSREIYEIVGPELIPIIPETNKLSLGKDSNMLPAFSFEYRYAHSDQFYSPVNQAQYLNADYDTDYGTDFYV